MPQSRVQLRSDEDIEWPEVWTSRISESDLEDVLEPWTEFCDSFKNNFALQLTCVRVVLMTLPFALVFAVPALVLQRGPGHACLGAVGGFLLGAGILNLLSKIYIHELQTLVWDIATALTDRIESSGLCVIPGFQEMGLLRRDEPDDDNLEDTEESMLIWLDLKRHGNTRELYIPRGIVYQIASPDVMATLGIAAGAIIFSLVPS
eukprot:TRINITY_DN41745_c0_g1_i1.p1 TRINITY_DN41745_c0_g1~~TRINITY_DN41745_c0_g1_i1.p1  ORF type:complete len:205 (+),score=36.72 TRINITY_DN41745_c0_g1_i1:50-664(+)